MALVRLCVTLGRGRDRSVIRIVVPQSEDDGSDCNDHACNQSDEQRALYARMTGSSTILDLKHRAMTERDFGTRLQNRWAFQALPLNKCPILALQVFNDELPSVRAVAKRHLVNPNTVARAYLELEREGIIYKRQGMGTYVADRQVSVPKKEKLAVIGQLIDKVVVQGIHFGLSADELKSELEKRLQALGRRSRDD